MPTFSSLLRPPSSDSSAKVWHLCRKVTVHKEATMPVPRIAMSKIRRLAALYVSERIPSISFLSKVLRISRFTVRRYQDCIRESSYSFADFATLCPREMHATLNQHNVHKAPRERYSTLLAIFPQVQAQSLRRDCESKASMDPIQDTSSRRLQVLPVCRALSCVARSARIASGHLHQVAGSSHS